MQANQIDLVSDRGGALRGGSAADGGYILPLVALLLVPLLIVTAFAVDVGAWYAQGNKMQRAADNAALAGVVWLPDQVKAEAVASEVMASNGFPATCSQTSTTCTATYPGDRQMGISFKRPAQRYFSQVFTKSVQNLTRSSVSTFIEPVPLGSPSNKLGNEVESCPQYQPTTTCGSPPMLWSAIQGPYESHANGDPYTTLCSGNRPNNTSDATWAATCGTVAAPQNADYKEDGYQFAIDVPAASVNTPITVEIWDAIEVGRTAGRNGYDSNGNVSAGATYDCNSSAAPFNPFPPGFGATNCQTGDSGPTDRNGLNMQFQLFENDGNDISVAYTTSKCELYIPKDTAAAPATLTTYKNKWATLCTFTPTMSGIYPMRVKSSNITRPNGTVITPGSDEDGYNAFSLRLTTTGAAQLYNLNNISIWTNTPGSTSRFYLAKIGSEHKGKKVVLDLFDPGDGDSGTYTLQVLAPPKAAPYNVPAVGAPLVPPLYGTQIPDSSPVMVTSCNANTAGSATIGTGTLVARGTCSVTTHTGSGTSGVQYYQDQWLRFEIGVGSTYSCTVDCWWTVKYDFGGSSIPHDRTVWSLAIIGDPVHLTS